MKRAVFGQTGIAAFPLAFGTLPLGPLQAGLTPAQGGRLIRHALEQGITLLDTATLYETYAHVRAGLAGYTGEAIVITKTHANDAATARAHVELGLRELGRERLEVVHLHGARVADPFSERTEVLETLLRMKEEGKIGHVGLSSHYICAVRKAATHPEIEIIHPLVNRTGMGILDGSADEMAAAIAQCAAAGQGVYAMKALAGGNLIKEARQSIAWVLKLKGVHGVAIGMLSEAEIDANIRLVEEGVAEDTVWSELESKRRKLHIMEKFCKGCGQCVPACHSQALSLRDGIAAVDEESCILCGYCAAACPEFLIRVV